MRPTALRLALAGDLPGSTPSPGRRMPLYTNPMSNHLTLPVEETKQASLPKGTTIRNLSLPVLCLLASGVLQAAAESSPVPVPQEAPILGGSPVIQEPYPLVNGGAFDGPVVRESPDPLIRYRWKHPTETDGLQIYLLKPASAHADPGESFGNLLSATADPCDIAVKAPGSIRLDFGVESGAWVEFDSPDCPGDVEMSISEYNEPAPGKTRAPVQHGNTYRLELNDELYEGVRFAWIHVRAAGVPWHITGLRAVCQVKPTNYKGSFSCSDPLLTRAWYLSAYGVKASLCKDYFGSILTDRGDRMSWTGDAHTSQAAALVAFGNFDFLRKNIDNTASQSNGIRSYSLYWVLSLLDYYWYTGDAATLERYVGNAKEKLDDARAVFGKNPDLRFYGWDERLCAGFEIWFKPCAEAQNAYQMLSIRAWKEFARAMGQCGRTDLRDKYEAYASGTMAELRKSGAWSAGFGLHAAADAIDTGILSGAEKDALYERNFLDRVNRLSLSPFNQYFIIQAMARMGRHDDALSSIRDMWGGMVRYGGTTTFEVYRPSWNEAIGPNDAVPNSQSGIVSLCHPWGAGVVKWLNEEVLGIVPTTPGFKTYDILPHPGRTLTQVSGGTPTPAGDIRASFDMASGLCTLSAPAGTVGRIGIPKAGKTIAGIAIDGKSAWDGAYHAVSGIGGADQDAEFVYLTGVQPGAHAVSVAYQGTSPPYDEPPVEYAAQSLKADTTTGGDWGGVYGKEGYVLCNYHGEGRDEKALPSYVSSLEYFRAFPKNGLPDPTLWAAETSDRSALASDTRNGRGRRAACYSNNDQTMTVTIGIEGTRAYQIALYFVDWDKKGRRQAVEMFDAGTLNLVAPVRIVSGHSGGTYLVYRYDRSVKFRLNKIRGDLVTLSGIFFDPAAASTSSTIRDFGLKEYVHLSRDLPHVEPNDWKLVCTMPYNCQFQPWIEVESPAGKQILFNSSNPLVLYLTPTETCTTTAGTQVHEAKNWVSGEDAIYTIPAGVIVKAVKYRETGYDTTFAGSFHCNDEDYNTLWRKAARTAYLCMRERFYDCPDRERVGFWGDGTVLQMFVDGVLVSEASVEGPLREGNTEPCLIGAESYGARVLSGWAGLIDHAAIWDRALSNAEIERLSGGAARVAARKLVYPKARSAKDNTRTFTADQRYLVFPCSRERTGQDKVSISVDGKPYMVVSSALITSSEPDHWRYVDLKLMQGKTLSVRIDGPHSAAIDMVKTSETIPGKYPVYLEPGRPQVHFSPLRGSFNDPSGMVYHEGRWHLYYANKRFYNDCGNLNSLWGHATSTDLLHWEEQPIFLSAVDGR